MRLTNISEIEAFKAAIERCRGDVWLESPYGDRFNLKSTLSRYVALGHLLGEEGDCLELFCQYTDDEKYFYDFFYKYPDTL